jgi:hypothetical protein
MFGLRVDEVEVEMTLTLDFVSREKEYATTR